MNELRPDEAQAALEAARADATELRRVARSDREALDALRRRSAVRIALAIDRRTARIRARAARGASTAKVHGSRLRFTAAALRRRRTLQADRAALQEIVATLSPPRTDQRKASIVLVVDGVEPPPSFDATQFDELVIAHEPVAATVARAIEATRGDIVCLMLATTIPFETHWLTRMAEALTGDVGIACPALLHPARPFRQATPHDLRVRSLGLEVGLAPDGSPELRAREAGAVARPRMQATEVEAASAACVLIDRGAYERAGGLPPLPDLDAAVVELCVRVRLDGRTVVAVPSALLLDGRPVRDRNALQIAVAQNSRAWRQLVEHRGAMLTRPAAHLRPGQMRFALVVAAPSSKVAERWGDWHLAHSLARALASVGHRAEVHTLDQADDLATRSADVLVSLRGLARVRRTPGQRHLLWIISHPETIEDDECADADVVVVASTRFASELRSRTSTPVEVLLQATDPERFRPYPPEPRHTHPVAVVAKTREILRPIVADALAVGVRPAIYGSGWDRYIDRALVVAEHVPNDELPRVYSSIGVLLNDHWETMRHWGFVSNRLFDALACGTPVISDHLPEISELFGESVATYTDPAELRDRIDVILEDPAAARRNAQRGREAVLASHTFQDRARSLVELLVRHDLTP